jgi:hypothetical protein
MNKGMGGLSALAAFVMACDGSPPAADPDRAAIEQSALANGQIVSSPVGKERRLVEVGGGCSGTLITEQWVLTASHCVTPKILPPITHHAFLGTIATDHVFQHPTLDVALVRMMNSIPTGYSGTIPLYTGSSSGLVGQTVTSYGFGWDTVDFSRGSGCTADTDCAAGYQCSTWWSTGSGGHWCFKTSHTLRKASFDITGIKDSNTHFELQPHDQQVVVPGDSGGPSFLSDGSLAGVHSTVAFNLTYSKDAIVPDTWVATRMACPLFDVRNPGDVCTPDCPCDIGQGDCDTDADCLTGLVCRQYPSGRRPHGFDENFDICVDPNCPTNVDPANPPVGGCHFSAGEGSCVSDNDCGGSLICKPGVSKALNLVAPSSMSVCVNQAVPGCLPDGCTDSCPCDLGQPCQYNADCRSGMVCALGKGALVGRPSYENICVEPAALTCASDADCFGTYCWMGSCRTHLPVIANPPTVCGYLNVNEGIYPNQPIYSCDGRFRLYLQSDSNLVWSKKDTQGNFSIVVWMTGTQTIGKDGYTLIMQGDGNLVFYDSVGAPLWATHTSGHPNEGLYLKLGNDGALTVRNGSTVYWQNP